jgi:hypothetical protein
MGKREKGKEENFERAVCTKTEEYIIVDWTWDGFDMIDRGLG